MSLSSSDESGQILMNWRTDLTPLKITLESSGVKFSGRGSVSSFDSKGIDFSASGLFNLEILLESNAIFASRPLPDDPRSIVVTIESGEVKCLLLGPNPFVGGMSLG